MQGCIRAGGEVITITGKNFGLQTTVCVFLTFSCVKFIMGLMKKVLVGGSDCTDLMHDNNAPHSIMTCKTPAGTAKKVGVVVLQVCTFSAIVCRLMTTLFKQSGGEASSEYIISYYQCAAGQRSYLLQCLVCLSRNSNNNALS